MVLLLLNSLVDLNEHLLVLDVSCCDQWLIEPSDWSRLLIYLQEISNIKKIELLPLHIDESHIEMSIILVRNEKLLPIGLLLNQIDFQIDTSNDHRERPLLLSKTVPLHLKLLIILLRDCNTVLRI